MTDPESVNRGIAQLVELCEFADAAVSWDFDEIQLALDYAHKKSTPAEIWSTTVLFEAARKFAADVMPADKAIGAKTQ